MPRWSNEASHCVFARLKAREREIFEETGLAARIGPDRFFPTVRAAVAAFQKSGLADDTGEHSPR